LGDGYEEIKASSVHRDVQGAGRGVCPALFVEIFEKGLYSAATCGHELYQDKTENDLQRNCRPTHEMPRIRRTTDIDKVPHFTTLQKAFARIRVMVWRSRTRHEMP
jgi:hypothetical protein